MMTTGETRGRGDHRAGELDTLPSSPGQRRNDTASQGSEQAARENEARWQALLSVVPDLVFIVQKDGVVSRVQCSKGCEFSLHPDELIGQRVMDLLPPQIAQQAMHYLEKTLRTGLPQTFHCQLQAPGGLRDFEARLAAWSKTEVVALVRDVADRRLMQKEILEISQRERTRIGQDLHD
ncbi:MAG TPA: PAS domain-containing protein, partial [Verrucomicrobiae bacterium]|nr:PAS domain-containing protein [Verrucomicrobiae bacterium]